MIGRLAGCAAGVVDRVRADRVSILIFHRVRPVVDDIFPDDMDEQRFDRIVSALAKGFSIMTLADAVARRARGVLPRRALVITFDDGYADNAEIALPILKRHGVPATFFVSTGSLDGGRMWNDTIIECLRRTQATELDLGYLGLGVVALGTVQARRQAILATLPKVKYLTLSQRTEALGRLLEAAGNPALPDDLMMRSDQVLELHRAGMEIGGHTVHHPILTTCDVRQARDEIDGGRQRLRELTGGPVDTFAYPNGRPGIDYDRRHRDLVAELGFTAAVTTAAGTPDASCDAFQLPRFTPWDRGMAGWIARLLAVRWQVPDRGQLAVA